MQQSFILLTNESGERRIVQGETLEELSPMLDLGFYPQSYIDNPYLDLDQSIKDSQIFDLEDLVLKDLLCWDNFFECFKTMENIYKNTFDPKEVFKIYKDQESYFPFLI